MKGIDHIAEITMELYVFFLSLKVRNLLSKYLYRMLYIKLWYLVTIVNHIMRALHFLGVSLNNSPKMSPSLLNSNITLVQTTPICSKCCFLRNFLIFLFFVFKVFKGLIASNKCFPIALVRNRTLYQMVKRSKYISLVSHYVNLFNVFIIIKY